MKVKIQPQLLNGTVTVPPSKSMGHRAIIAASLAEGQSVISNIQYSQDMIATIEAMETVGAKIEQREDSLVIQGINPKERMANPIPKAEVNCHESGSTIRFLIPLLSLFIEEVTFTGYGKLTERPQAPYFDIFDKQGIEYETPEDENLVLPLTVRGQLKPGRYELPGNISSQFITGLLYTLALLDGDSEIVITTEVESIGYIDLTLSNLAYYGIKVDRDEDYQLYKVAGNQTYQAVDYTVEGDFSQAAFFLCAAALGSNLRISGLDLLSAQADREILDILENMGVVFYQIEDDLRVTLPKPLKATRIDGSQCPDIIPVVAMTACLIEGETIIHSAERLRIKESDRIKATVTELQKMGANIEERPDGFVINGVESFTGADNLTAHNDHRIAMMLSMAATRATGEVVIDDAESVRKSFPEYWEVYQGLGGQLV